MEEHAKLIAFDRQNHMGMSESTANTIRSTLEEEAAHMHEEKGASTAIAIHENEKRLKELKVGSPTHDLRLAGALPGGLPTLLPSAAVHI